MIDVKALLPKDHVILHLEGRDRRALFEALAAPLVAGGIVHDEGVFLDDLEAREDQVTTQMEGGIAFPHARSMAVGRLGLTVGVADAPGVSFDPESGGLCRVFFLIAIPTVAPTAHLPLLRTLAGFARRPEKVGRLLRATTPAPVVRALASFRQ